MQLRIEQIQARQVETAHAVLVAASADLKARFGLDHWDPPYPLDLLRRDAQHRAVYSAYWGDAPVATFTLNMDPPPYIDLWGDEAVDAVYVSHLAVLHAHQGHGIGTACIQAVESMAAAVGCGAVRLDAYRPHAQIHTFFARLGYEALGVLRFGPYEGVCYQKRI